MPEASESSAWSPLRHRTFAILWGASLLSNIGTWMHDVGAGWLMTSLSPSPLMVSLVQAATSLPVFLLALPAGALADIVDRRRALLFITACMALVALALGLVVLGGRVTAPALLAFTFAMGVGAAMMAPAWQSVAPQVVPRAELPAAVALNSVCINISRAIGPALGGAIIATAGIAWPFLLNAVSFIAVIAALLWWRPPAKPRGQLPAERIVAAMRTGLRYARSSPPLRATLARAIAFFIFCSAYWALLPLVARQRLDGDAQLYGLLVTCVGIGAVGGALLLPRIRSRVGVDRLVALGTLGTAVTLLIFAFTSSSMLALAASLLAGASWIAVLSSLNVSAQMSLPDWVRARGLSVYNAVFFGSMTLGSVLWGQLANRLGIPVALAVAAVGAVLGIVVTRNRHLQAGAQLDLAPSSHWPQPLVAADVAPDAGPVMVTVRYRIDPARSQEFRMAMDEVARERRRNGAFAWGLYQDAADPAMFLEYFLEESWLEHLRHHDRVTQADRDQQARAHEFHVGETPPSVSHYLAGG
jgi:MFS family permease